MVRSGELVQPLINLLVEHLHQGHVLHLDETTLQVLDEPGKTAQSKSYLWLMASFNEKPATVFHYAPTRSQSVPQALLSSRISAIMVDGYDGYQKACDHYTIKRLGCSATAPALLYLLLPCSRGHMREESLLTLKSFKKREKQAKQTRLSRILIACDVAL